MSKQQIDNRLDCTAIEASRIELTGVIIIPGATARANRTMPEGSQQFSGSTCRFQLLIRCFTFSYRQIDIVIGT